MLTQDLLTLAATAYESGRITGRIIVLLLVAAVLYRYLVLPRLTRAVTPPLRHVIAGAGVLAVVVLGVMTPRDGGDADRMRAEMLAGCEASAGPEGRSYCGCVVDEVLKRSGTDRERLGALAAEIDSLAPGHPVPAVLSESAAACGPQAG